MKGTRTKMFSKAAMLFIATLIRAEKFIIKGERYSIDIEGSVRDALRKKTV